MARALPMAYIFRPRRMLHMPGEQHPEHGERPAQGAQAEADLPEVGLGDDHVGRRLGVRRVQPVQLLAEGSRVHRHRLDTAAAEPAAGRLGVVVGVLRHPGEAKGSVLADEVHDLGAASEEGVAADLGHVVADDRVQVEAGLLRLVGTVDLARCLQGVVAGDPDATAASSRGTAEPRALLHHDGLEAAQPGRERGGHARAAGTDHDHVDLGRQARRGPCHGAKL